MPDATPLVFVVDHDASLRESVRRLIQSKGLRSDGCGSAREFLARPRTSGPCCLVLDVRLPDVDGLQLQARVAVERAAMPIIFVASCRDVTTIVRAMKAGAFEFLSKPFDGEELMRAVHGAIEHSRATLDREAGLWALRARSSLLSVREREVMTRVVAGLLNKQIGGELGISEITVKAHRGRVMRKMQAVSLAHLIDMARRLGLPAASGVETFPRGCRWDPARLSSGSRAYL